MPRIPLDQMTGETQKITIKGVEYSMSPITLAGLGEILSWYRDKPLRELKEKLEKFGSLYDADTRASMIAAAEARYELIGDVSKGLVPETEIREGIAKDMDATLNSIDGIRMFMWISLRKAHPELTFENVGDLIDLQNMGDAQQALNDSSFISDCGEKKTADGNG